MTTDSSCLRALGGLIRFRLIDRQFLSETEYLGARVHRIVKKIITKSIENPQRRVVGKIAKDVLTVLEKRGAPDTILQWDDDGEGGE